MSKGKEDTRTKWDLLEEQLAVLYDIRQLLLEAKVNGEQTVWSPTLTSFADSGTVSRSDRPEGLE